MSTEQDITPADIDGAIAEIALAAGRTRQEIRNMALAQPGVDCSAAGGWATAVAQVTRSFGVDRKSSRTARMIEEYTARYPALSSTGDRLCLTASQGGLPQGMSDADANTEILRLTRTHNGARPGRPGSGSSKLRFDVEAAQLRADSPVPERVELSESRQWAEDGDSALQLTAGGRPAQLAAQAQVNVDAEVFRLANQDKTAKYLKMSDPDRTDTLDVATPSVSDLRQQVNLPTGDPAAVPEFSEHATEELGSLPQVFGQAVAADVQKAASAPDNASRSFHVARAHSAACQAGAKHLSRELGAWKRALGDAGNATNDPAAAQRQIAGDVDVAAEVERLSSAAQKLGSNGNRAN